MKPKMGREIALLMVPILVIGGVALWRGRDDAPEDLWSGKARIVTRVRQLEITPFDMYRGYTHRIAVDGWAAGDLPPVPPRRAGALKTFRRVAQYTPPLLVAFRQGRNWKSTLPSDELAAWDAKEPLPKIHVAPDVASLWVERAEGTGEIGEKFSLSCLLRLPATPRVMEAVLKGRIETQLEDRDQRMVGGVRTEDIVKQRPIFSEKMRVPLEVIDDQPQNDFKRESEWKVVRVTTTPPGGGGWNYLDVSFELSPRSGSSKASSIRMAKMILLDAKGRRLAKADSYSFGTRSTTQGGASANANFSLTLARWKKLAKPLTFQAIVSVNDGWPEEVNVELGKANAVLPPKKSKLPFIREPLPLR
ncbi:MAG TPA: hypothetical protein VGB45_07395 [Abditibacterium sp.]|jgi:hypothetical protein